MLYADTNSTRRLAAEIDRRTRVVVGSTGL
jgi:hypothetical protein